MMRGESGMADVLVLFGFLLNVADFLGDGLECVFVVLVCGL